MSADMYAETSALSIAPNCSCSKAESRLSARRSINPTASLHARRSRLPRTWITSRTLSIGLSVMKTPRFGMFSRMPSCRNPLTASHTGVRLTPKSRASSSTLRRCPGLNRSAAIIIRSSRYTLSLRSSPFLAPAVWLEAGEVGFLPFMLIEATYCTTRPRKSNCGSVSVRLWADVQPNYCWFALTVSIILRKFWVAALLS